MATMRKVLSYKTESRIRIGSDSIAAIPTDLHTRLGEMKSALRYPTMWSVALRAMDLGLMMLEKQQRALQEELNVQEKDAPATNIRSFK